MDKLEVYKFLEAYNLPKLNHTETRNLNIPITSRKIESVIKTLSTNQSPRPDTFNDEVFQIFKEDLISTPFKVFHKFKEKGTLENISLSGQQCCNINAIQGRHTKNIKD